MCALIFDETLAEMMKGKKTEHKEPFLGMEKK